MEIAFKILSGALIALAVYYFWRGDMDGGFVSAVLGAVSYLLALRCQIKRRMKQRETENRSDNPTVPEDEV